MIIAQMVALKLLAGASAIGTVAVTTPTTGWKFLMDFDVFRKKRDEEEEKRKRVKELVKEIKSPVDREIATLLQADLDKQSRKDEISELQRLIARDRDFAAAKAHNARIAKVFVRAALQKNFSAVEALERELDKKIEEDEFLMLALIIAS